MAQLLSFSHPSIISEEVVKENSSFKVEFICGLFILIYSLLVLSFIIDSSCVYPPSFPAPMLNLRAASSVLAFQGYMGLILVLFYQLTSPQPALS